MMKKKFLPLPDRQSAGCGLNKLFYTSQKIKRGSNPENKCYFISIVKERSKDEKPAIWRNLLPTTILAKRFTY